MTTIIDKIQEAVTLAATGDIAGAKRNLLSVPDLLDETNVNATTDEALWCLARDQYGNINKVNFMSKTKLTPFTAMCALGSVFNGADLLGGLHDALLKMANKMAGFSSIDWSIRDSNGNTMLQWAVWSGSTELVELSLKFMKTNNFDINEIDTGGRNAIDIAFQNHVKKVSPEMVKILKEHGVKTTGLNLLQSTEETLDALLIGEIADTVVHDLCKPVYNLKQQILQAQNPGDKKALLDNQLKPLQKKVSDMLDKLADKKKLGDLTVKDAIGFTGFHWLPEINSFDKIVLVDSEQLSF